MLELSLPSRIESVEEAAQSVGDFLAANGHGPEVAFAVDLAVRESVANAVKHGNKFDETKQVLVSLAGDEAGIELKVRDQGEGFDIGSVPDPTDPANLLKANGRGLLFMNNFMDEVRFEIHPDGGTVVVMVKRK
ncbi:MAG: ATP-binding protein [Acidobacteria bacterium]|nr:ATP-binding protein [Acidobacteriota bacterium]MCW5949895.1 ATP-binding protein [Pyrinomonadaceae bacterium]